MVAARLVGDIGATYVRFALASGGQNSAQSDGGGDRLRAAPGAGLEKRVTGAEPLIECTHFSKGDDYTSLEQAIEVYLNIVKGDGYERPTTAALAIAGPVSGDEIVLTNRPWKFSKAQIAKDLCLEQIAFYNDFAAVARAVRHFRTEDLLKIGGGEEVQGGHVAIIGPGTGLGVAGLLRIGGLDYEIAGEGGHATLAANDMEESRIIELLRLNWQHVSLERVLSGSGLVNLYSTLCTLHGIKQRDYGKPEDVTAAAFPQEDSVSPDMVCRQAFSIFCNMLGTAAGNLALSFGAAGGVYIAGGILPKFPKQFADSEFRQRFEAKGRLSYYVRSIPTWLILNESPALVGLANMD